MGFDYGLDGFTETWEMAGAEHLTVAVAFATSEKLCNLIEIKSYFM